MIYGLIFLIYKNLVFTLKHKEKLTLLVLAWVIMNDTSLRSLLDILTIY